MLSLERIWEVIVALYIVFESSALKALLQCITTTS